MSWKTLYQKAPSKNKKDLKPNKVYKSWLKDKKLVVRVIHKGIDKLVHFGQVGYSDFTIHKDTERRKRYLARAKGIKNKKGELTYKDRLSPNYWAVKILW